MAIFIDRLFEDFLASPQSKLTSTDYNECTLMCRFAAYLSAQLPDYHVECGRNIEYFGLDKKDFYKRDIDIVIYKRDREGNITEKYAIEMKCPTESGRQTTQRMEEMLLDIAFKEQLLSSGDFDDAKCIVMTDVNKFGLFTATRGRKITGKCKVMYDIFRDGKSVSGIPLTKGKKSIEIKGPVQVTWLSVEGTDYRYYII